MTIFINILLIIFAFIMQLLIVFVFKKTVTKKEYRKFIILLVADFILSVLFGALIFLNAALIFKQINLILLYLVIGLFYLNYTNLIKINKKNEGFVSFVFVLLTSVSNVLFGKYLSNFMVSVLYTIAIIIFIITLLRKPKAASRRLNIYILLVYSTEVLRYLVSGILTYQVLTMSDNNIWIISLAAFIKAITVLFVVEIHYNKNINDNIAKMLDYQSSTTLLNLALSENPAAVIITDKDRRIIYANPQLLKNSGYTEEEVIGKSPKMFSSGKTHKEVYKDMNKKLATVHSWQGEFINKKKNGDIFIEDAKIVALTDQNNEPTFYLGIKTNITKEKEYLEDLRRYSSHDTLTGLLRRNFFIDKVREQMQSSKRINYFLLFDINEFKSINDTLGHQTGDEAIKYFAHLLEDTFSKNGYLCRFGGDEFAAFLYKHNEKTVDDLIMEFYDLLEKTPLTIRGKELIISASVGIVTVKKPFKFEHTYEIVDKALYEAKKAPNNIYKDYR